MKKNKIGILLVAMLLIGICVLLYPSVSQYWNAKTQSRAVENYRDILASLKPEDYTKFFEEAENSGIYITQFSGGSVIKYIYVIADSQNIFIENKFDITLYVRE